MPTNADRHRTTPQDRRFAATLRRGPRSIGGMSWAEVGAFVRRERVRRRQRQAEFANEIGISVRVLGSIESAERTRYSADVIAAVESALGWAPGEFEAVGSLGAHRPRHLIDPDLARIRDAWPRLSAKTRANLAELAANSVDH